MPEPFAFGPFRLLGRTLTALTTLGALATPLAPQDYFCWLQGVINQMKT